MKKHLNIDGAATVKIKSFFLLVFLIFILSCTAKDETVTELRFYSVIDYPGDSIWVDTITLHSQVDFKGQSTATLIHSIDSALSLSSDSTRFRNIELKPKSKFFFKENELIRYYAGVEFELGMISFYGVHLKGFGTVYLRWLDGHKALLIKKTVRDNEEKDYSDLASYLDSLIYTVPNIDTLVINTEYGIEDSMVLDLDTTLFNYLKDKEEK